MSEIENQQHREPIRLPFEPTRFDVGEWFYDHRYGICMVVIFYLVVAIAFVSARIVVENQRARNEIMVELPTLVDLKEQRDELQRMVEQLQQQREIDWENIKNEVSNEDMTDEQMRELIESGEAFEEFDEFDEMEDYQSAEEFMENFLAQQEAMARNQSSYAESLDEINRSLEEIKNRDQGGDEEEQERRDSKVAGGVTASYSFTHPTRHAQKFAIPAYQCMGGGEVRIAVMVGRDGKVLEASHLSGGDECMRRYALEAARNSRFSANDRAPQPHRGVITYFYVPQ